MSGADFPPRDPRGRASPSGARVCGGGKGRGLTRARAFVEGRAWGMALALATCGRAMAPLASASARASASAPAPAPASSCAAAMAAAALAVAWARPVRAEEEAPDEGMDMGLLLDALGGDGGAARPDAARGAAGSGRGAEEVAHPSSEGSVTSSDVGRAAWMLFHTVAAEFPERPSRKEREAAKRFFLALPHVYPCKKCADHFADVLKHEPPRVGSRAELVAWVCHVHNVVNRRLGKPTFPCDPAQLHARWGTLHCDSGGGCARPK